MKRRTVIASGLVALLGAAVSAAESKGHLAVDDRALSQLDKLRGEPKFVDQFGITKKEERARLEPLINNLVDRLRAGIKMHPEESWVISQMEPTVAAFYLEDTELREPCVSYLLRIFKIVGMKGANGAFSKYYLDL